MVNTIMDSVEYNVRDQMVRTIRKRDSGSLWYRRLSHSKEWNDSNIIVDLEQEPILNSEAECTVLHEGNQMISEILPVNIDILFETLNSDSRFLQEFNKSRKIFEVVHYDWQNDKTVDGCRSRSLEYKMPLKPILGPKYSMVSVVFVVTNNIETSINIYIMY